MRTLNTYILRNFLVTLGMALGIMSFVLVSGNLCKSDMVNLFISGASPMVILRLIWYMLPYVLCYTLPLAILIATVLVFSRLSADNEVVAMKTMGISLWQIVTPPLLCSILSTLLCLWLFLFVTPHVRDKASALMAGATVDTPLAMLEPGSFKLFSNNCYIKVGAKRENELDEVHIVLLDKKGHHFQDIVADSGKIAVVPGEEHPMLTLTGVELTRFNLAEPPDPSSVNSYRVGTMQMPLEMKATGYNRRITSKRQYMDLDMLCAQIALQREDNGNTTPLLVELHGRLAIGMASFSFFLLGLPFGIRSRRSELSIGLLICVVLALFFFGFKSLTGTLSERPGAQYLIWIPNLLYQIGGLVMMRKLEFRG